MSPSPPSSLTNISLPLFFFYISHSSPPHILHTLRLGSRQRPPCKTDRQMARLRLYTTADRCCDVADTTCDHDVTNRARSLLVRRPATASNSHRSGNYSYTTAPRSKMQRTTIIAYIRECVRPRVPVNKRCIAQGAKRTR